MCTNSIKNPWGLSENFKMKCMPNMVTCCTCLFKNGKVADVNTTLSLSKRSTPDSREK